MTAETEGAEESTGSRGAEGWAHSSGARPGVNIRCEMSALFRIETVSQAGRGFSHALHEHV